jgi:hypothetical protein
VWEYTLVNLKVVAVYIFRGSEFAEIFYMDQKIKFERIIGKEN